MSITVQDYGSGRQWAQLDLSRFRRKEKAEANNAKVSNCGGRRKNCRNSQARWHSSDHRTGAGYSHALCGSPHRPPRLGVSFANEICDSGVGFRQSSFLWQEHDTEVLRARFLAEAGTVHDHHMFLADKFLHKDFVGLRDIDARESVESAAGRNTAHTGSGLAPLLSEIAA